MSDTNNNCDPKIAAMFMGYEQEVFEANDKESTNIEEIHGNCCKDSCNNCCKK